MWDIEIYWVQFCQNFAFSRRKKKLLFHFMWKNLTLHRISAFLIASPTWNCLLLLLIVVKYKTKQNWYSSLSDNITMWQTRHFYFDMKRNVTKCHSNKTSTPITFTNLQTLFSFSRHKKPCSSLSLSYACTITTSEIHELTTQEGRLLLARVGKEEKGGERWAPLEHALTRTHTHTHAYTHTRSHFYSLSGSHTHTH